MPASILNYCQFQIVSQTNYTLTYLADRIKIFSHDAINRVLQREDIRPKDLWEEVKGQIVDDEDGYVLFDDTVLDKRYSRQIEGVRSQYSGNAKTVIRGIGVVTCLYVNPKLNQFWAIDFRIYNPATDGKDKNDHVKEMLKNLVEHKKLRFKTVLMDSWYASQPLMRMIEGYSKIYYCPLKKNRLVDESNGVEEYKTIEELEWSENDLIQGKLVKLHKFPGNHKVKLFRVTVSNNRTEYVATNDLSQDSTDATREQCAIRWKIEELHRELKQLTGIEKCQCRKEKIQRNHIGCAMLAWARLKEVAYETKKTIYQLKQELLDNYVTQELLNPSIQMKLTLHATI